MLSLITSGDKYPKSQPVVGDNTNNGEWARLLEITQSLSLPQHSPMPFLRIHPLDQIKPRSAIKTISSALDPLPKHPVNQISWPEFAYQPDVQFAIAYSKDAIFLKFYVTENHIRHVNTKPNSPV